MDFFSTAPLVAISVLAAPALFCILRVVIVWYFHIGDIVALLEKIAGVPAAEARRLQREKRTR